MQTKKLICLLCCLFMLIVCSNISCSDRVELPKDVRCIYIEFAGNGTSEDGDLFEKEYVTDGNIVTNVKPDPGTKYIVRSKFRGTIVPLAVGKNDALAIPIRYFVTPLPFGQSEVRPWQKGDHMGVSVPGRYWFKLRANENGLVFAVVANHGKDIWIYPHDLKAIAPTSVHEKYVQSLGQSLHCVEIPPTSLLLHTTKTIKQITQGVPVQEHSKTDEGESGD